MTREQIKNRIIKIQNDASATSMNGGKTIKSEATEKTIKTIESVANEMGVEIRRFPIRFPRSNKNAIATIELA